MKDSRGANEHEKTNEKIQYSNKMITENTRNEQRKRGKRKRTWGKGRWRKKRGKLGYGAGRGVLLYIYPRMREEQVG